MCFDWCWEFLNGYPTVRMAGIVPLLGKGGRLLGACRSWIVYTLSTQVYLGVLEYTVVDFAR